MVQMMKNILNWRTVFGLIVVWYLRAAYLALHELTHPVEWMDAEFVKNSPKMLPLWTPSDSYSVYAWMSPSKRFQRFSYADMKSSIVLESTGLAHHLEQPDVVRDVTIMRADDAAKHVNVETLQETPAGRVVAVSEVIWNKLLGNSTGVYLHVLAVRSSGSGGNDSDVVSGRNITELDLRDGSALHSTIQLVKHDVIPKHFRYRYLLSDLGLVEVSAEDAAAAAMAPDTVIAYFKPEVVVKLVSDTTQYPTRNVPRGFRKVHGKYKPSFYADEIGLTSDKYVPLNDTVRKLPLKVTIGPMSPARSLLMMHLEHSLSDTTHGLNFPQKDVDDMRRLIADTSLYLIGVTVLASFLHLIFELLAFRSDVAFWMNTSSMTGLSIRALTMELVSQSVVFLYLIENDTSYLVLLPAFASILIQAWKVVRAMGLLRTQRNQRGAARRKESEIKHNHDKDYDKDYDKDRKSEDPKKEKDQTEEVAESEEKDKEVSKLSLRLQQDKQDKQDELALVTAEADARAMHYLIMFLLPVTLAFMVRSLVIDKHRSWYAFAITTLTGATYAFGFAFMLPQLFINHRLKSVSHLPWEFLVYKCCNTFIDDLFAFIIKMPTMHRISCFRDDIVFVVYVYQRYMYHVDAERPSER